MSMRRNGGTKAGVWALGVLAAGVLAASCATTDMTSTWTDPNAKHAALSNIAVISMTPDPGLRRMAEETAAAQMKGAHAVPSYQVLSDADLRDREVVKVKLKEAGFDGVLIMRVTGVSEQVSMVGGPYGSFDAYYNYAGSTLASPGYLKTDKIVHVLSNLYSLEENKLIWSGVSETFDPSSTKSFVKDVSKAVAKSLHKDRLIL